MGWAREWVFWVGWGGVGRVGVGGKEGRSRRERVHTRCQRKREYTHGDSSTPQEASCSFYLISFVLTSD